MELKFKIEKNIPIPARGNQNKLFNDAPPYPFKDMENGDSFHVKAKKDQTKKELAKLRDYIYSQAVKHNTRVSCRITPEVGIRIWKVGLLEELKPEKHAKIVKNTMSLSHPKLEARDRINELVNLGMTQGIGKKSGIDSLAIDNKVVISTEDVAGMTDSAYRLFKEHMIIKIAEELNEVIATENGVVDNRTPVDEEHAKK